MSLLEDDLLLDRVFSQGLDLACSGTYRNVVVLNNSSEHSKYLESAIKCLKSKGMSFFIIEKDINQQVRVFDENIIECINEQQQQSLLLSQDLIDKADFVLEISA